MRVKLTHFLFISNAHSICRKLDEIKNDFVCKLWFSLTNFFGCCSFFFYKKIGTISRLWFAWIAIHNCAWKYLADIYRSTPRKKRNEIRNRASRARALSTTFAKWYACDCVSVFVRACSCIAVHFLSICVWELHRYR